jgi:multiple sugar transport system ATP-binding protein
VGRDNPGTDVADLVLDSVTKDYGRGHGVRDLSLRVEDGEFMVLVGPSGCGKTTTLRLIAGLETPDAGAITIGGRPMNGVQPKARDIAMVFQGHALYPHMTVRQNMLFPLRMRRLPKAEAMRKVDAAAERLGISDLLDRKPRQLSGGQRQRAAVGKAMVREPKVFLFDEPLSNLDPGLRLQLRAELKALHQSLKVTTVYVTHDQEEAMTLGDRLAVMQSGRLRQVGPPLSIYNAPADRFVAGFIGSPPMNFLEGEIVREATGPVFTERGAGGGRIPLDGSVARSGPAVIGVRPQSLAGSETSRAHLRLQIRVVEPMGDSTDVLGVTPAGAHLRARVMRGEACSPGETIGLTVGGPVHLFSVEGARLA